MVHARGPGAGGCTPTPRCSPPASRRCCCRCCTRWRWPGSPATAATRATRGAACSARATTSRRRPSARSSTPRRPSRWSARSTSGCAARTTSAGPTAPSDPHLLMWVHVAEIDSFLRGYQTFGDEPLTDDEADVYVAQAGIPAGRLGVIDPPTSVAELRTVLAAYRPELEAHRPRARPHASCCSTRRCPSTPGPATAPSPPAACPCCPGGRARCSASRCPASCRPSWRARSGTSARRRCGGAWPGSLPAEQPPSTVPRRAVRRRLEP